MAELRCGNMCVCVYACKCGSLWIVSESDSVGCSVMSNSLQPHGL